ncbi:ATP-binding protein [Oceanobacter sp. 5_MG-2023]|uniref:ATP-binding protein n=1 Tax=Oceanobacter sp. 5_MG-2023 TaxID=3062645 RepID=UPI0026E32DF8|nr:ATP-binding protein [Oceanobacter sp. 5_MG-2023]MDO6682020.1 ATP-binding protein [Oceanobacter sp. 5_MG-2023]
MDTALFMRSLASPSSGLNQVLQRLALLQLAIATVWLLFLSYLHSQGVANLEAAWVLLALYLPLQVFSQWQVTQGAIQDWQLFLHLSLECQLFTGLLFFTGGATNPLISYFLVLLVLASYGLPWILAIWMTALCVADYSLLSIWYQPLLLHHGHAMSSVSLVDWHLSGMWLTFVLSALILVTLIPQLIRTRQRQQQEIQQLREQQLKNEQLVGIGTLAAGTAHEMGTPLMTMGMLLDDLIDSQTAAEIEPDLSLLREQVNRCQHSLQELARQGREARDARQQLASDWLKSQLQRWQLSQPNAVWQPFEHHGSALIHTSPLLDQALLNLLNNAAEAGQQPIELQAREQQGYWMLDIIQPDPHAAASLSRYSPYNSSKQTGLGIGLYLSNASVEQFGGNIELQALPDGGSRCTLSLPISFLPEPQL